MYPDLMHPACEWSAEDDAGLSVVTHPLELCPALFALRRDLADADLVADDLDRLVTLGAAPDDRKMCACDCYTYKSFGFVGGLLAYSGNSPSTLQTYSLSTCLFLICCSMSLALRGFLPNMSRPEVSLSSLWMVRRFFKLYSLARMKTTVLWR